MPFNNISKGGLLGAILGMLASVLSFKNTDSKGKKALKTGSMGILGYLLGSYAEKKINKRK